MSWVKTVEPGEASGKLRKLYDAAVARAGRVFQILRVQSANPELLEASLELYRRTMF